MNWSRRLLRRRHLEQHVDDELRDHLDRLAEDHMRAGLSEMEARRRARLEFGGVIQVKEAVRDQRGWRLVTGLGQDVRLGVRALRSTPIVTAVAILSLALGIGANTAIFSIVNALLLRNLPVKEPDRLVLLSNSPYAGGPDWDYPIWREIVQRTQLFDGTIAWSPARFNLASSGETQFVEGVWANGSFFKTLGVRAWLGRTFSDADDARGGGPDGAVAVISHGFWQRRLGGTPDVIHRTLTLDHVPFTIVGVSPPGFFGIDVGRAVDVFVPLGSEPLVRGRETWLDRHDYWLTIMARLRSDQTIDAATRSLRSVQPQIRESTLPTNWRPEYLDAYLKAPITLERAATGPSVVRGRYQRALLTILVVVALVLLIACANIANLLLARATARRHELSVRVALGASRWRLIRQLSMESAVLAATGAALGTLLASWGSRLLLRQLSTASDVVFLNLSLDWRVLAFTIGVGSAAALLFGLAPAWTGSTVAPIEALKERGPHTRGSSGRRLGEGGLVVAQVALSLVLVIAAGLFARTFLSLATRQTGFDRKDVLLVDMDAQSATPDVSRRIPMYERVREQVRGLPGVRDAALSALTPVAGRGFAAQVEVSNGAPFTDGPNVVSPGWFSTLGIPLVYGRDITDADRPGTPQVAIVNQTLARASLNVASPLGHTITMTTPGRVMKMDIVGVVADSVYFSLRETVHPTVYTPLGQFYFAPRALPSMSLNVRTIGPPALMAQSVAEAIRGVSPLLAMTFQPLADQISASLNQERLMAILAGFFGALALLLAGLGLYGVTAYSVVRRRAEIGIRMALGAGPASVVRLVLSRVTVLVCAGVVIGSGASIWMSKFVAALVYGVEPHDAMTVVGAASTLAAIGAFAGWLPARRASRIDPAEVLRES